jgi:RNA polymerase sigma-70 factor (ECF subfamily)
MIVWQCCVFAFNVAREPAMRRPFVIPRRILPAADNMSVDRATESGPRAAMDSTDRVWREKGLLAAVLAGDERAWQTWYEESFDGLYAYVAWRCGGNRDWADNIVQETWLTVVRRIRSFEPERGSFASWLRGIAANVLKNLLRSEVRRERRESATDRTAACCVADSRPDQQEQAERVGRALAALPERYEAVLQAKYLDGLPVAEIAGAWNETPKAVESLLTRARQAFREAYLKLENDDEHSERHGR